MDLASSQCDPCLNICKQIASYYNGDLTPFRQGNRRIIRTGALSKDCHTCKFIREIYHLPGSSDTELAIEIYASNYGTLYLQSPSITPNHRTYLLPLEPSLVSVSGRLIQPQCDVKLIRQWLRCCDEWHSPDCYPFDCKPLVTPLTRLEIRLIDTQRWRIVSAPHDCRYVALSYVWGSHSGLRTTRANLSALETENGLRESQGAIPRTILDAIHLVNSIGETYLWVDSLCIVQDDSDEKHGQIRSMDAIYGNAFVTISAAAGMDSQHGLPGVNAGSRLPEHVILNCSKERNVIAAQTILTDAADATYWNTRAWTYQERFLSKRSLIFTDDQVFFQCQRMIWCEEVVAEREDIIDYHQMEDYQPISWASESKGPMYKLHYTLPTTHKSSVWDEYVRVVEEYTPRTLTYESDILNAFAGMSKVLESIFESTMLCGLPESMFHCALLWHPAGRLHRRCSSNLNHGYFPTWSWAGWKGDVTYEDILPRLEITSFDLVERTKPLVQWRKRTADGLGDALVAAVHNSPSNVIALPSSTSDSRPNDLAPQPWTRIVGRVMSMMLYIRPAKDSAMETTHRFSILTESRSWCGSVWLDEKWEERPDELHEFIVISEGWAISKGNDEGMKAGEDWAEVREGNEVMHFNFYNVLLVEREGDLAFRVGIGKVDKALWDSLPTMKMEICLA